MSSGLSHIHSAATSALETSLGSSQKPPGTSLSVAGTSVIDIRDTSSSSKESGSRGVGIDLKLSVVLNELSR